MSASDPFQELVDTLKRILTRSASPPLPASIFTPVTSAINSSSPVMFASPMARPAPYSGEPEECNGFLLQCSLTIDLHPQMFLTDQAKIAFVITSLTGLCLYCGGDDHRIQTCTLRPPRLWMSGIQPFIPKMNPLTTCAHLIIDNNLLPVTVLLDSGSAGNFISGNLCQQLRLSTTATETTYQIQTITGTPLTRRLVKSCVGPLQLRIGLLHQESIHLLVLEESTVDIILGLPWLVKHDPVLSWKSGDVLKWGSNCFPQCFPQLPQPSPQVPVQLPLQATSIESPVEKQSVECPSDYASFSDVFCPKRAS